MTSIRKEMGRFTEASIDDEVVLMNVDTGEFYALDGTAAVVWRLIGEDRSRGQILDILGQEFDGDPEGIAQDVDKLLETFKEMGLVAEG